MNIKFIQPKITNFRDLAGLGVNVFSPHFNWFACVSPCCLQAHTESVHSGHGLRPLRGRGLAPRPAAHLGPDPVCHLTVLLYVETPGRRTIFLVLPTQ